MSKRIFSKDLYVIQDKCEGTKNYSCLSDKPAQKYENPINDADIVFNSLSNGYISYIHKELRSIFGSEPGKCRKIKVTVTLLEDDVQVSDV